MTRRRPARKRRKRKASKRNARAAPGSNRRGASKSGRPSAGKRRRAPRRGPRPAFSIPPFQVLGVSISAESQLWGENLLGIGKLWLKTRGEGVLIGVVDSGIAIAHPDLADAVVDSRDFTGSATGVGDDIGHGTHVAGIIAAAENGRGVVGVAPRAKLLNARAIAGADAPADETQVAAAISWCTAQGADLINLSLSSPVPVPLVVAAILEAQQAGTMVICAAGNTGPVPNAVGFPARNDQTLAVGYVRRSGSGVAPGFDTARGTQVDLVAPGGGILSTYPPNLYARASGTSMAAPFVTGVAALVVAFRKARGLKRIDSIAAMTRLLTAGATDLYLKGRDDITGVGLINPARVLAAAESA